MGTPQAAASMSAVGSASSTDAETTPSTPCRISHTSVRLPRNCTERVRPARRRPFELGAARPVADHQQGGVGMHGGDLGPGPDQIEVVLLGPQGGDDGPHRAVAACGSGRAGV
jgi:hypothetical protein